MKRKKMLCRALLMVMALLMMMTWTAAALAEGETAGNVQDAQAADNTQLFWQYLLKTAKPAAPGRRKAPPSVSTTLDEDAQAVYNALRPCILAVANGTESSTEFTLDAQSLGISALSEFKSTYTCAELGLADDSFTSENGQAGANAIGAIINNISGSVHKVVAKAVDALQMDMPYEFYWFDKTKTGGWGSAMPYTISYFSDGTQTHIDHFSIGDVGVTVSMAVSADYSLSGGTGTYQTDSARIQAAQQAAVTAGEIVAANASLPDDEKLKAYKTAICGMVDYNHAAAGNDATLYGDPWQLIWVFDGDPETMVVCEGYAKAFQYLNELSGDADVSVICVSGLMIDEYGGGNHMWNVVNMDNGKNYMADITNCDMGEYGSDELFLVSYIDGNAAEGYAYIDAFGAIYQYVYRDNVHSADALEIWDKSYLESLALKPDTAPVYSLSSDTGYAGYRCAIQLDAAYEAVYIQETDETLVPDSEGLFVISDRPIGNEDVTFTIASVREGFKSPYGATLTLAGGMLDDSMDFPDGLTVIEREAFRGAGVTAAVFPESIQVIGEYAFADNPDLQLIELHGQQVGEGAFNNCQQAVYCIDEAEIGQYFAEGKKFLVKE